MARVKKRSVTEAVEFRAEVDAEVARETRRYVQAAEQLKSEMADLRRMLDFTQAIDQAKIRPAKWKRPKRSSNGRGIVTAMLTDTHFDEVVDPVQVDHFNAYDRRIAELRLRAWADNIIDLALNHIGGVEYDGCVILVGGDLFSGNIHDELKETNAGTLFEAVVHWIEPLISAFRMLADAFGKLELDCVVGNHGRMTRKPRSKDRAQDNVEWLMYRIIERELRDDERITVNVADGADLRVQVYDTRYLLTHGDQFRGGSGISGALSPLMLGLNRKSRREIAAGVPFDWLVIGHWHQYWHGKGVIVGGTLKGVDEHAWQGNFEPEPAQQAFWITDPKHGVVLSTPIHVVDKEAEGWA
jgi:hypothetical protein